MFGLEVTWAFQWHEIFKVGKWNWVNFDLCNISLEVAWFKGKSFDVVFILFGVGFYLNWYDKASRDRFERQLGMSFKELMKDINDENS